MKYVELRVSRSELANALGRVLAPPQLPPSSKSLWRATLQGILQNWGATTFAVSVAVAIVACLVYRLPVTYPFQELAFRQKELDRKEAEYGRFMRQTEMALQLASNYVALGDKLLDIGQYAEAKLSFEKALKFDPLSLKATFGAVKSEVFLVSVDGQYDPEIIRTRLQFVLANNRNDPHALTALGHLEISASAELAKTNYEEAILGRPSVAEAHFGLGNIYLQKKMYLAAQRAFEQAKKLSPWNVRYLINLAHATMMMDDYESAIATYQEVLRLDSDYLLSYVELADALRFSGQLSATRDYLTTVLKLFKDAKVTALRKNMGNWYFPVNDEAIYLAEIEQKRAYVLFNLAAVEFLLDSQKNFTEHATALAKMELPHRDIPQRIFLAYLKKLEGKFPTLKSRLSELRSKLMFNDRISDVDQINGLKVK